MLKIVKNLFKSLKMLTTLISWINCFECLFTCPGKIFPLTAYINTILHANTLLKRENINILYLKILKRVIKWTWHLLIL